MNRPGNFGAKFECASRQCMQDQLEKQYVIPLGTVVSTWKLLGGYLTRHVTRKELHFERYEKRIELSGPTYLEFRHEGWVILVNSNLITTRPVPRSENGDIRPWAQPSEQGQD
jgi:hypothetical protein